MLETHSGITKRRSPLAALVLSYIMNGLGHIYCGKLVKGIVLACLQSSFIFLFLVTITLDNSLIQTAGIITLMLASLAVLLFAVIDSWRTAKRTSEPYILKDYNRWYVYLFLIILHAESSMTATLYFTKNILGAFIVPFTSNYPTMVPGDRFVANKLAYKNSSPKRGDNVVFSRSGNKWDILVRRVVAIGGDTVEIKNNELYINNRKLERRKLPVSILDRLELDIHGQPLKGDVYEETNGSAKYKIFIVPDLQSSIEKITVPVNHCFVLGDNRSFSYDSRDFGPVLLATIIGRADYLFWPAKDWSRIGKLD